MSKQPEKMGGDGAKLAQSLAHLVAERLHLELPEQEIQKLGLEGVIGTALRGDPQLLKQVLDAAPGLSALLSQHKKIRDALESDPVFGMQLLKAELAQTVRFDAEGGLPDMKVLCEQLLQEQKGAADLRVGELTRDRNHFALLAMLSPFLFCVGLYSGIFAEQARLKHAEAEPRPTPRVRESHATAKEDKPFVPSSAEKSYEFAPTFGDALHVRVGVKAPDRLHIEIALHEGSKAPIASNTANSTITKEGRTKGQIHLLRTFDIRLNTAPTGRELRQLVVMSIEPDSQIDFTYKPGDTAEHIATKIVYELAAEPVKKHDESILNKLLGERYTQLGFSSDLSSDEVTEQRLDRRALRHIATQRYFPPLRREVALTLEGDKRVNKDTIEAIKQNWGVIQKAVKNGDIKLTEQSLEHALMLWNTLPPPEEAPLGTFIPLLIEPRKMILHSIKLRGFLPDENFLPYITTSDMLCGLEYLRQELPAYMRSLKKEADLPR